MPERPRAIRYEEDGGRIRIGDGIIEGVRPEVWRSRVSGTAVVRKWLGYRTRRGAGRTPSSKNPLDQLRQSTWPEIWSQELVELLTLLSHTVDLQASQAELLHEICRGPTIPATALPQPTEDQRATRRVRRRSR